MILNHKNPPQVKTININQKFVVKIKAGNLSEVPGTIQK